MKAERFIEILGSEFYTGVPDSQLKPLCDYLMSTFGIDPNHHIIAANEGNCTALAAGYHLATGKIPVVYMQNSGEGNVINPLTSLLNPKVYAIPTVFVIGWRGEPGVHDEPQHIFQGEITLKLLDLMEISYQIIGNDTPDEIVEEFYRASKAKLSSGKSIAFVIRKGGLSFDEKGSYKNNNALSREDAIRVIAEAAGTDPIVSTTGKASRELFEIREANGQGHGFDFLTVGSMGHSSSIALGIAVNKNNKKVWCIDGDGAVLMHMGAMAVIGSVNPSNMIHIIINNNAHETVGGMPTVSDSVNFVSLAIACGYKKAVSVDSVEDLKNELMLAKNKNELCLIEIKCSIGSRKDLGRPTTTPIENKEAFMTQLMSN